jgi:2-amino-4-hydroxy-6-hydroxymethyldihydropteridine diphosphokinase
VVLPLAELAPDWCHPQTGQSLAEMAQALPADQRAEPIR